MATLPGGKIPSRGDTTPEHNAVRKSRGEIEPAIIRDDFIRQAHSCGLIPARNPSNPPLDVVLNEISRDPVNYYSLQHVLATTLNVGGRFNDGIRKMEKTFQLEMRKYSPAGPSEDPKIEPEKCPKVFISFSRRKVFGDSPDAYTEAKGLYDELEAQGCKPWMDEKGLEFGDVLAKEIFWAIKQCDFIIPIMTGGYATSLWCLRELYYAALQTDSKPKTIIPMLLEDEDIIDNQKAGKWLLRIGTGQKYFRKEEKADMIKSLKDKLKENSSAPAPVPTPPTNDNPSLTQTEATMHIPFCTTADLDEEDMRSGTVEPDEAMETDEGHAYGDVLAAWVPKNVLWGNHKKELTVKFLNNILPQWTYGGSGMNVGNIMSWANEWYLRGGGTIPKFTWVEGPSAPSDIRIEFNSNRRTETMIGKRATKEKYDQPTMWLDLNVSGDNYKKHLVIHEFGHALGLGHEHQRSDFWKLIKPYVDIEEMKKDLKVTTKGFEVNWDSDSQFKTGKCTAYDPYSIMHYWFKKQWLKSGYSDQSKVETDRDSGVLPKNVAEALLGVHLRSSIPLADKPSDMDIQLLKDLYGNTSCTILGLPSQSKTLQGGQEMPLSDPSSGSTNRTVTPSHRFKWCGWPLQLFVMMLVLVAAGLLPFTFTIHPTGDVGAKPVDGEQYSMRLDLADSIFDERPDMMKLRHLELPNESSLDIAERIGDSYKEVGGELLQDSDGIKVKNIHADNFYRIIGTNNDILFEWLQGSGKMPVNWKTLIQVLEKHGKKILAQDIRTALLMNR